MTLTDARGITIPTPPACPTWCVKPAGHEYELAECYDPDIHVRYHSSLRDGLLQPVYVRVEAGEMNDHGEVFVEPPTISIYDDNPRGLSIREAVLYAAALLRAAGQLAEIKGVSLEDALGMHA